jgi:hypothetical protein
MKPNKPRWQSLFEKDERIRDRDFDGPDIWRRKAVCKRCHSILHDCEPCDRRGEFWHIGNKCKNSGKRFSTDDIEIEPFVRKRERRAEKRCLKRFRKHQFKKLTS